MRLSQTVTSRYYQTSQSGFGKDFERTTKKLFDHNTKKLTEEALMACELAGINPNDLYEKPFEQFKDHADTEEIAEMRYEHFENRRKNKLKIIANALNDIYRNRAQTSNGYGNERDIAIRVGEKSTNFFNQRLNRASSVHYSRRPQNVFSEGQYNTKQMEMVNSLKDDIQQPSQDKNLLADPEKDYQKIARLVKIKENIENIAKKDVEKLQKMLLKQDKHEKNAKEYRKAIIEEAKMKQEKIKSRRIQAKELLQKQTVNNEKEGVKVYSDYIREVEERKQQQKKRERMHSYQEYESYKKKFEHSVNNNSFYYDKIKELEKETEQNLDYLGNKLNRGYDKSQIMISEKAMRASIITEKIKKVMQDHELMEQEKMEKVFSNYVQKRVQAEEKLNKRQKDNKRQWKDQRKEFQEKFSKIKEQQQQLQKEQEKKKKTIIDKHEKDQEHKHETKGFIYEEITKKREWSHLKKIDQQENLQLNQRQQEIMKLKLIEKHIALKSQLDNLKNSQQSIIEQRRQQDVERRKITEEIGGSVNNVRQKYMSQSLAGNFMGKKNSKIQLDEDKNKDLVDAK